MSGVEFTYEFKSPSYLDVHIPLNIFIDNIKDFNLIKKYWSTRVRSVVQVLENKEFFTNVGGDSAVPTCCYALYNYGYLGINIVLDPPIQIYK